MSKEPQTGVDGQINMPIFPLRTVLFPGGILPLSIFEPRYVDMIRWCMREQATFGVVLLRQGSEVNTPAGAAGNDRELFKIGTEAEIIDFNQADNGLLGIVAQARRKFSIVDNNEKKEELESCPSAVLTPAISAFTQFAAVSYTHLTLPTIHLV